MDVQSNRTHDDVFPYCLQHHLQPLFEPVFQKWCIPLLQTSYSSDHGDLGKKIKKLLLSQEIQNRFVNPIKSAMAKKTMWDGYAFTHTPQNLTEIAKKLGITIFRTKQFDAIRDHLLRLPTGELKVVRFSNKLETANFITHSSNLYLDKTAATHTKNQIFNSWSGFAQSSYSRLLKENQELFGNSLTPFEHTYAEGGNVWMVTNSQGDVKVLIGADHLIQNLHIFELERIFWEDLAKQTVSKISLNDRQKVIDHSLTQNSIKQSAEEMFAQGLLLLNKSSGLIDPKQQLSLILSNFYFGPPVLEVKDRNWFKKAAITGKVIPSFHIEEGEMENIRTLVAEYLAKKEITHELMAKDFGVDPQHLHFITQFNYHLDTFMCPGPHHSIFLINFSIWVDLLKAIFEKAENLKLSPIDLAQLSLFIETSQKMHAELGPLLDQVRKEIEAAGITVIPFPGHLLSEHKTMYQEFPMISGGCNMNFVNSLTGWSPETQKHYYITHGLQAGEKLGGIIMDAFTLFLRHYIPDIELYFIGRNPQNLEDLSEAMDWWNRLETQMGIHCTTFEMG